MKIVDYITDKCPDYALSYLVNCDASGIDESDKIAADQWADDCRGRLEKLYPEAVITLDFRPDDEGGFVHSPAFGLPCNAVDCAWLAMVPNDSPLPEFGFSWNK
jgi:hypothetical protein